MAQTPLEQFCIEHSLVLVGQLARWREEFPDTSFEDIILMNHAAIQEDYWLDEVLTLGLPNHVLPPPHLPRLPAIAGTKEANVLRSKHKGIILQDSPVLVVGIFNPFAAQEVDEVLSVLFPGRSKAIVFLSPHTYSQIGALVERGTCNFTGDWGEDLEEWCASIGRAPSGYLDIGMIVEDIWFNGDLAAPVILPGQYSDAVALGEADALLVKKTPLHAWAITPRPFSKELYNEVMQKVGLSTIFLAVGPREFGRLKQASKADRKNKFDISRDSELHISDWGVVTGDEVGTSRKIVYAAIEMGASDIHMEPKNQRARIRFRVDNELLEQAPLPISVYRDVLRRLKIMGVMMQDVSGVFQDGAGYVDFNGVRYDLRFSISIVNGGEEAIVVRIFNSRIPDLADLRLKENEMKVLKWFLDQETGMVVCSGPTGSGKTTLLYALLNAIDSPDLDLVTIEQPVEKFFENAKQITVYEDGKLTYGSALRSILRQDPDVIMIGEIRDNESAIKAVEASMTGHLVLTTTHANSAVGVIERLAGSFPVDRVALATALKLSIAQRLVGRLCPYCKKPRAPRAEDLEYFPPSNIARPIIAERVGCSVCRGTGISGRLLLMEMMPVDDAIREMIAVKRSPTDIEKYNRQRGFLGLIEQASYLLQTGEITLADARRFITRPLT